MGPRSADRGKGAGELKVPWKEKLQWGRGQLTAESQLVAALVSAITSASMGPRSADRGKLERRATRLAELIASMGPRSADRGKRPVLGRDNAREASFNGAAVS